MSAVTMLVADEALQQLDMEALLTLLNAREIGREPASPYGSPTYTALILDIPDAPDDATSIEPVFRQAADGTISVMSMGWR
ncbi:hypothetical protein ABZ829_00550 [Streptomyces xanthochromogenes]|uniref:hypothetical protein n=1 Tax=Streptomyces xanthochromogenes TaxID=67384 RepID=UPI0034303A9E